MAPKFCSVPVPDYIILYYIDQESWTMSILKENVGTFVAAFWARNIERETFKQRKGKKLE